MNRRLLKKLEEVSATDEFFYCEKTFIKLPDGLFIMASSGAQRPVNALQTSKGVGFRTACWLEPTVTVALLWLRQDQPAL